MNKILTISIAAYNTEKYIKNSLDSLLINSIDDVEILVEDDGGTDNNANIIREYEKKYPDIVKLIHKKNGGYGSTINKSIELAKGKYFKQLDGDDWFNSVNFKKYLELLRTIDADIIYTPYEKYNEITGRSKIIDHLPKNISGQQKADDVIGLFKKWHMHSLTYRTRILRENHIKITEHRFYTDAEYALFPIPYITTIYAYHSPIYVYRIGREGQSVSAKGRQRHYRDHIALSNSLIDFWHTHEFDLTPEKRLFCKNVFSQHANTTIRGHLALLEPSSENLRLIQKFEEGVHIKAPDIYQSMEEKDIIVRLLRKTNYKMYKFITFLHRKKNGIK